MDLRQQILDAPRALRETLERGRTEYDSLVRRVRWGEGPVFIVGAGSSFLTALTGVYAFEYLLGWPVIARPAMIFEAYAASVLRPRSIVLALSHSGESAETLGAARAARARGATLLALTNHPSSALAQMADLVFLLPAGDAAGPGPGAVLCQQAALNYLGLVCARAFKRHHRELDVLEEDFVKLPGLVERIHNQLLDGVRALANEIEGEQSLSVVGGGFFHPVALLAARMLSETSHRLAQGIDAGELQTFPDSRQTTVAILFLSGSRCRVKKKIHALAQQANRAGTTVLSVADSNDRELSGVSKLSVFLPELTEMVSSTLTLALMHWVAYEAARGSRPVLDRHGPAPSKVIGGP